MAAGLVTVVTAASANMPICFMNILHCRLNIVTLRPYSYDTGGGWVIIALDWTKINSRRIYQSAALVPGSMNMERLTDFDQMHPGAMSSCGHSESQDVYQLLIVRPRHGKQRLVR